VLLFCPFSFSNIEQALVFTKNEKKKFDKPQTDRPHPERSPLLARSDLENVDHTHPRSSPLLPHADPENQSPSSSSSSLSARSSSIHSKSSASSVVDEEPAIAEKCGLSFYTFVLRERRFLGGVTCYIAYSIIVASFDTTLPLHVRDAFNWGSLPSGLMFVALQGPGIIFGPLAGSLKDRVGTRLPAAIAFLIMAPSIWLMGMPGDERFTWLNVGRRGQAVYVTCMLVIGCMIPLLNSVGTLEVTRESSVYRKAPTTCVD
jgi:hypothetical protein